jgi:hypothetical protein
MPHLVLLIGLLAGSTSCSLVGTLMLFAMVGEINRKRDESDQIPYFHFSWVPVLREYRTLYPQGKYAQVLYVTIALTVVFSLAFVYLLFVVLPKYALPSR